VNLLADTKILHQIPFGREEPARIPGRVARKR
jgi:hypothetical protein